MVTFVLGFLKPAIKHGVFEFWVDRHMRGGVDLDPEIERRLRACDIFILLVSRYSMASDYIVDREIATIRERQKNGEDVHFYPLLLTHTPEVGLAKVKDKNLRPRDARPFSSFHWNERERHMSEAADEIAKIAEEVAARRAASLAVATPTPAVLATSAGTSAAARVRPPELVHISHLPETGYKTLVGRDAELARLDGAWENREVNILSLVAEGGAGKSALLNEWLTRLRRENYRGAEVVLGWSFYSQGSKERATSAGTFLDWALEQLGHSAKLNSASAKGEAIAEVMTRRRVLLALDGVEPLQHGPGPQAGRLKDQGVRALLRSFAAKPPANSPGLIVLTSRAAVEDVANWKGDPRRSSALSSCRMQLARRSCVTMVSRGPNGTARRRRGISGVIHSRCNCSRDI